MEIGNVELTPPSPPPGTLEIPRVPGIHREPIPGTRNKESKELGS